MLPGHYNNDNIDNYFNTMMTTAIIKKIIITFKLQVTIPSDPQRKEIIDLVAHYVATDGDAFEKVIITIITIITYHCCNNKNNNN